MIINKSCIIIITVASLLCTAAIIVPSDRNEISNSNFLLKLTAKLNIARHSFYRSSDVAAEAAASQPLSRRMFGGAAAALRDFPAACALLDRYWAVRCSASVLTERWVLTAGHCVSPRVAYVKYNTRRPASAEGNVTAVHFLYRHPKFVVEEKDEGRGMDVTTLHHDVGLLRTRDVMRLATAQPSLLSELRVVYPQMLFNKEVQVLGFGRTERSVVGEELFSVQLRVVSCERRDWLHCVCGVGVRPRGVCSGDSGGPVLYRGSLVGVTSMGPTACAEAGATVAPDATSVLTSLHLYAGLINATICDTESALRMRMIARATTDRCCDALCTLAVACFALYYTLTSTTCC